AYCLAQAPHSVRLLDQIARGRLATIGAVQPQPALQIRDPRRQSRDLLRLRRNQRNKLFPRRLGLRIPTHRILESETTPVVYSNLKATWAVTAEQSQREKRCDFSDGSGRHLTRSLQPILPPSSRLRRTSRDARRSLGEGGLLRVTSSKWEGLQASAPPRVTRRRRGSGAGTRGRCPRERRSRCPATPR